VSLPETTTAATTTTKAETLPVYAKPKPIDPNKPIVALSFDDGPSTYTRQILKCLAAHNAVATFVVLGNRVNSYAETIQQAYAQGCEIISHTWDHKDLAKLSVAEISVELVRTNDAIARVTGRAPNLFRPPYGRYNDTVSAVAKEKGLSLVLWSVDSLDWSSRDSKAVQAKILRNVKNGSIILCHDLYGSTADAMEALIPELQSRGFQFVTLTQILQMNDGKIVPGKVYSQMHKAPEPTTQTTQTTQTTTAAAAADSTIFD
jgi:peptidoglycan/xylan/chitin deacetylase (PgdA/CDA1 family)